MTDWVNKNFKELKIWLKKNMHWNFFWTYKSSFKWQWIDFKDLKEYTIWDPIKNIDRNSYARQRKLFTKHYEQERDLNVIFVLDMWNTMDFGTQNENKIDILSKVFFLLWMSAVKNNDNVWVLLFNNKKLEFLNFTKWEENIIKWIDLINNFEIKYNSDVNNALEYLVKTKLKDSLVFVLTDKEDYNKHYLRILNQNNEICYINIFDEFENKLNSDYEIWLKWKWNIFGPFINWKKKKIFIESRKKDIMKIKYDLKKYNIDYVMVDSSKNIFKILLKLFFEKQRFI